MSTIKSEYISHIDNTGTPNILMNDDGSTNFSTVRSTDHMEGVGEKHSVTFSGTTEQELTIPSWATRIEVNVAQAISGTAATFEIVVKKGTGTDYGTVSNNNAFTTWINNSSNVGQIAGVVNYLRVFFPYSAIGTYWTSRGVGTIYLKDLGNGTHNMTASFTGCAHQDGDVTLFTLNYSATGFGNVDVRPTVLGLKCPISGLENVLDVTFYA